jgi:ABC-2 type transport system ATP-binding protein
MPELALDIQHVVKRFAQHVAVRELSLQVPQGAVYGLLGPNGAGKTTTIRMILNIIMPDTGTIRVLGMSNTAKGLLDRVGYLPEERGLYKKMQVRRLLRFLAELKGIRAREADRRIGPWLERLTLKTPEKDWGAAKVDELSRGMQQKVQFIACLLHDPDIVILDEPFSGLDPINAQALKDVVVELKRRGKTILFSTHLMESAERMCDSVCIIARGEKVLDGSIAQVKAEHGVRHIALAVGDHSGDDVRQLLNDPRLVKNVDDQNRFFEVELADGANAQELLRRVVALGVPIERFELVQPSLHQIFLDRVGAKGIEAGVTGHG